MVGTFLLLSCLCGSSVSEIYESHFGFDPKLDEYNRETSSFVSESKAKLDYVDYSYQNGRSFYNSDRDLSTESAKPTLCSAVATTSDGIYGTDDRVFIPHWQYGTWPYMGVVQIKATFNGDSSTYFSTGALVGPNLLLTASHCVHSSDHGWFQSLHVYIEDYQGSYTNSAATTQVRAGSYFQTGDSSDDWAFCKLDQNLGSIYGFFNTAFVGLQAGDGISNIAYNGCTETMSTTSGTIDTALDGKFYHHLDAVAGSSGSPIFYNGTNLIVGIHSGGYNADLFDFNISCKVTASIASTTQTLRGEWAL